MNGFEPLDAMDLRTEDFEYRLPPELIAYAPARERHKSRLMVLRRDGRLLEHTRFDMIADYFETGDTLVINDTRVIKARLVGAKQGTGGKVELLLVREVDPGRWEVLASPSRRLHAGTGILLGGKYRCTVAERLEGSRRLIDFHDTDVTKIVEEVGQVPLPPYIKRLPEEVDEERYQTVYARQDGSVAAPTAGLHFSEELLETIEARGVETARLTLHVGPGTFLPVRTDDPRRHVLEPEYFEVDEACCKVLNRARRTGRRIFAVGTTSIRALETVAERSGGHDLSPQSGWTHKFIIPPYEFKVADAMITNFHLPRSTLLMLVCAFAGRDFIMEAYEEAVERRYRFFSYGDAMLII
jgi:S-adenosylmethionine:tRNA ribosyltransferase-isomerase